MNITNWYTGVVEDINDPLSMGRVQVRCLGYHTPDRNEIPTQDLPWATCIMPVTSAGVAGVGTSATGLVPGSWVFGFFRDGLELQDPVVLGTIASASGYDVGFDVTGNFGFGDSYGTNSGYVGNDIPLEATNGSAQSSAVLNQNGTGSTFGSVNGATGSVSSSFEEAPVVPNISGSAVDKLISVAETQVGIIETSKNQGPGIQKFWTATANGPSGYSSRAPYCAAFVSWCIKTADILPADSLPNTAGAMAYNGWASKQKFATIRYNPRYVKRGDICVFASSHVAIATSDSDANGVFNTIEGNCFSPTRNGQEGVYKKVKRLSALKSAITFATTTDAAVA